jgi:hypothetical protein
MKRLSSPAPQIVNFDRDTQMIDPGSHLRHGTIAVHDTMKLVRWVSLAIALVVIVASPAHSGEFFGTIKADGKALPKGVKIEITSPAKTYTTETDAYGSYRLFVTEKGKCELKIYYKTKTPSFTVFS